MMNFSIFETSYTFPVLSFSLSDLLSIGGIILTAWIALQTHRLQKRQLNADLFPRKMKLFEAAHRVYFSYSLGDDHPDLIEIISTVKMAKQEYRELFDEDIAENVFDLADTRLAMIYELAHQASRDDIDEERKAELISEYTSEKKYWSNMMWLVLSKRLDYYLTL